MTAPTPLVASQASLPAALDPLLREPERSIVYHWWTRWADHRAGTTDARHTRTAGPRPAGEDDTLDTPWLARLFYERDTAIRAEQRTTAALISVLDAQVTTTATHKETLEQQLEGAKNQLSTVEATDPAARTPSVAESYSNDAEIATHSANLHAATLNAAQDQLASLRAGIRADQIHIAELERDIATHHHILAIRTLHLAAWYQRRAATYTRAHTRRGGTWAATPEPETPTPLPAPDPAGTQRPALTSLPTR